MKIYGIMAPKNLYKLAKTIKKRAVDIDRMIFVKDSNGKILCKDRNQG